MELKDFLEKQEELDKFFLEKMKERGSEVSKKELLNDAILAAMVELGEYANELKGDGFKHWSKKPKSDKETRIEEFVDVWHFMFSIANQEGFSADDIEKAYKRKYEINCKRQLEGY